MALINCPECASSVSDTALKCPTCAFQLRTPKRGFLGKLFKWVFILFNLLMVFWLFSYLADVGELVDTRANDAERSGAAVGAAIGTSMLMGIWGFGAIILGLLVIFTRPKG